MISDRWINYINDIANSLTSSKDQQGFNEHFIGVIDDNDINRYNDMVKTYINIKEQETNQGTNLRKLTTKLDLHLQYLGKSSNSSFTALRKANGDIYNENVTFNTIDTAYDKLNSDTTNNLQSENEYKDKLQKDFRFLKQPWDVKKAIKAGFDIPISLGKKTKSDYKKNVEFNTETPEMTDLYNYYSLRKKVLDYFKDHYTYVFIGKDKSNIKKKTGDKGICATYCLKNCIYQDDNNNPFNSKSERYIKNNTNKELLKIFKFHTFPRLLKTYLNDIGADENLHGTINDLDVGDVYCKCATDTNYDNNNFKWIGGCYKNNDLDVMNKKYGCGPLNTYAVEGFSDNIIEGMNVYNENDDWSTINNKITGVSNSNDDFVLNKDQIKKGEIKFNELTNIQYDYSINKDKLKNNDKLYNQMYSDNLLISKRQTLIRYLIIFLLIFSILLILKYINVV